MSIPYRRILICGCARSGNTLMLHLIGAGYRNVRICHGERIPERTGQPNGPVVVGKRPGAIIRLDRLLGQSDLGVILMIRDPRDVICSRHVNEQLWAKPDGWVKTARIVSNYRDHTHVLVVHFERLLKYPGLLQQYIGDRFDLEIRRPFVECYEHFDRADKQGMAAMHGARPLDTTRIGHWQRTEEDRQRVAEALRTEPELHRWMEMWGYLP